MKFKIITIFFLMCSLFAFVNGQTNKNDWIKNTSNEGKFSIDFPQTPKLSKNSFQAATGVRETFWFTVNEPAKQFAISYTDYQNLPKMNKEGLKINYDNLRDSVVKQSDAEILSDKDVWLGNNFGRELEIKVKEEIVTNQMFLVGQRLYQVIITMPKNNNNVDQVRKFLASFKIL